MRRYPWIVVVLVTLSFAGAAEAQYEIWTNYYNCNLVNVGWQRVDECTNDDDQWGQQYGAYRQIEWTECAGGTSSTGQWYYWDGSGWVAFSGPPGPNC